MSAEVIAMFPESTCMSARSATLDWEMVNASRSLADVPSPTSPERVIVPLEEPVASMVRVSEEPSSARIVLENETAPAALSPPLSESTVTAALISTGPVKEIDPPSVLTHRRPD